VQAALATGAGRLQGVDDIAVNLRVVVKAVDEHDVEAFVGMVAEEVVAGLAMGAAGVWIDPDLRAAITASNSRLDAQPISR